MVYIDIGTTIGLSLSGLPAICYEALGVEEIVRQEVVLLVGFVNAAKLLLCPFKNWIVLEIQLLELGQAPQPRDLGDMVVSQIQLIEPFECVQALDFEKSGCATSPT